MCFEGNIILFLHRKLVLLLNNVIAVVGVGLQSLAVHPAMFITGRFVIGICAGKQRGGREGGIEGGREGGREGQMNRD